MSEVFCNPLHYVEVMKHKYEDTLTDWCCNALSHVLEFNGPEGLGQILAGNVNVRQGKTVTKKFTKSKKKAGETVETGIFGAPLTSQGFCQTRQLIDYLRRNTSREGLFRIPGNSERQRRLKAKLNASQLIDLNNDEFTAHDVACVIKTFLGELPEPLLTEKHYLAHVQATDLTCSLDTLDNLQPDQLEILKAKRMSAHITALTHLFLMLPSINFKLLKELLELLHDVSRQHEVNKMTANNLGMMFAPHLLWPRYLTTDELKDQKLIHKLNSGIEFMIEHYHSIFKVPASILHRCEIFVRHGGTLPDDSNEEQEVFQSTDHCDSVRRSTDMISAPRKPSINVRKESNSTEVALAELYANVQAMPGGSKKRKLMKQFAKNSYLPGTPPRVRREALKHSQEYRPRKHSRSKSVGEVLIKQVGTSFSSRKKKHAPPPPVDDMEAIRMHNANREICKEFRSNLIQTRPYRQRANSCDALDTQFDAQHGCQTRVTSPLKPARPAPRTPDAKVSQRPVSAPRGLTPKVAISQRQQQVAAEDGADKPSRPTATPRQTKRNNDGQPVLSPRNTTNNNKPVPKPRMVSNILKENNQPIAALRFKMESAL